MGKRSVWKGPFVDSHLLKKATEVMQQGKHTVIKTWSRRSTILPIFVGLNFAVYNGKKFIPVPVTERMIGKNLVNLRQQELSLGMELIEKQLGHKEL